MARVANRDWDKAVRRIEAARESGKDELDLAELDIDSLPPGIAGLTGLQSLNVSNTQITDAGLPPIAGLTGLQSLDLDYTQITDTGLTHIARLTGLQGLGLENTQITDTGLTHIARLTGLRTLYLTATNVTDLRPLLELPLLAEGRWGEFDRLFLRDIPAIDDPAIAAAMAQADPEDQRQALLAHLRSLPPWPEPLRRSASSNSSPPEPRRIFTKLTMRTAREMLEANHPLIRDRCQAVVAELDQGLAYHRLHIPNEDQALEDHRQVDQALTYAKAMMESVHDAVPEDFTDRPLADEEVSRFREALNTAIDHLTAAAKYVDRPGHTPTYGGLLKLGTATAVGGVFALIPGVQVTHAIPAVFAALYGKYKVMGAITSAKGQG